MLYTVPDYYDQFECIAGECEDTCCAGWQIVIDKESLQRYRKENSKYCKKLHHSIDWKQKTFRQDVEKRCAFLKDDNLCEMYQKLGEKSLCKTCQSYPRHTEEFENVREISLSLSCPVAARLILGKKDSVRFQSVERDGEEEFAGFDPFLYSNLLDAREIIFEILQDRNLSIETRTVLSLGLAYDMENRVRSGNLFSCDTVFRNYKKQIYLPATGRKVSKLFINMQNRYKFNKVLFEDLWKLELLRGDWEMQLAESQYYLFAKGVKEYGDLIRRFKWWMQEESEEEWAVIAEQLMVYYVFTYFCGAVYDERIFVNLQMAAACTEIIWNLLAARWMKNGEILDMEDIVEITYRFSRELEHSDDNLKKLWRLLEKQRELFK
ncbi:MAG: flagellin lysine-N-methylase [Schaedlerella sp.]|nr:flagellin lysine-N-methylase [Schaedlerella sp.]